MGEDMVKTRSHNREPAPLVRELVVMAEGHSEHHALPETGTMVVGRAEEADICIDDPSISRQHAILHLGKTLQIEDAGSSNGTLVHGQQIEPGQRVDIEPGDFFEVGAVVCLIRGRRSRERLRQLRTHAYFDARLQDEVARASGSGAGVAVLRIHLEEDEELERELLDAIRPGDVLARYAPDEYEVLLADASSSEASAICDGISARLAARGNLPRTGVACY